MMLSSTFLKVFHRMLGASIRLDLLYSLPFFNVVSIVVTPSEYFYSAWLGIVPNFLKEVW
jgi:hypothetical protein